MKLLSISVFILSYNYHIRVISFKFLTPLQKNEEIQPPDPPPKVPDVPKLIRPKPLSPEIPPTEPEKLAITPPSVDNSIVALKRLENRARRTRIAASTKTSKPPTARGYRFT